MDADQEHAREREDTQLLQSLENSSGLLEGQAAPVAATPQELSQEHAALLASLTSVQQQNPQLAQHLVQHIQGVIRLSTQSDALPSRQQLPQPGEVLIPAHETAQPDPPPQIAASDPQFETLIPDTSLQASEPPAVRAPESPPDAIRRVAAPMPQTNSSASPGTPQSPVRGAQSSDIDIPSLEAHIQARRQQWRSEAHPDSHAPDLVEDPGLAKPPDLVTYLPQFSTEMTGSLRDMETMFRRIVTAMGDYSRSLNEMQSTLNRNGIF